MHNAPAMPVRVRCGGLLYGLIQKMLILPLFIYTACIERIEQWRDQCSIFITLQRLDTTLCVLQ